MHENCARGRFVHHLGSTCEKENANNANGRKWFEFRVRMLIGEGFYFPLP